MFFKNKIVCAHLFPIVYLIMKKIFYIFPIVKYLIVFLRPGRSADNVASLTHTFNITWVNSHIIIQRDYSHV